MRDLKALSAELGISVTDQKERNHGTRHWTPEEKDEIRNLMKGGKSYVEALTIMLNK